MNQEKIQILIVDDNLDISRLIAFHFGEEDYGLTVRNDGDSAEEMESS